MRGGALLAAGTALLLATPARAERPVPSLDLGARAGVALPVGAFDATTRAADMTFGGTPLAIDGAVRLGSNRRWSVAAGALVMWTPTSPRLCGSTSECIASIGQDTELDLLVRIHAPKVWRVTPEAELAFGWSWSVRPLADADATSTRRWSGPVVLRAALVPTFALGLRTRLGVVVGGNIARSTTYSLEAPRVVSHRLSSAAFHGTFEVGVRFGFDLFSARAELR